MTERTQNADFRRKPQIFAGSPILLEIQAFGGRRKPQKTADFHRKPKIFAENRRKPQIGLRHLRCVTFSSALVLKCPPPTTKLPVDTPAPPPPFSWKQSPLFGENALSPERGHRFPRFLPICGPCFRECPDLLRFFFRTNQNKSGKPLSADPFRKPPKKAPDTFTPGGNYCIHDFWGKRLNIWVLLFRPTFLSVRNSCVFVLYDLL